MANPTKEQTKTLIIVILDESGSMGFKKNETIAGYNDLLTKQRAIPNDSARLYLVKFNSLVSVMHRGVPLDQVPNMSYWTFLPGGNTALYDAIAEGVRLAEKDKLPEERVVCVIMTDGVENASRETTKQQVRDIIQGHERMGDWTFMYIGVNPIQFAQNGSMSPRNAYPYNHHSPRENYERAHNALANLRLSNNRRSDDLSQPNSPAPPPPAVAPPTQAVHPNHTSPRSPTDSITSSDTSFVYVNDDGSPYSP